MEARRPSPYTYLEGTYSEIYPNISQDEQGLQKLFLQFSFPGGIPSHVSPECPGSIHEGGELGYSLSHSFGAVFDNPELVVACVVGDGEAETGPLATAWHSNKFLNPVTDGAVLPILHLNGYKKANPTIFARISREELEQFFLGCGWKPYFVEGHDPAPMHEAMSATLDRVVEEIKAIQHGARTGGITQRPRWPPRWPMIVLNSPKGWTGPAVVDGRKIEGTFRSHQDSAVGSREPSRPSQAAGGMAAKLSAIAGNSSTIRAASEKREIRALSPSGDCRMERQPPRERRHSAPRPSGCRTFATTRLMFPRRAWEGDRRYPCPRPVPACWSVVKLNGDSEEYGATRHFRIFGPSTKRYPTGWKRFLKLPGVNGKRL